jgi:hypothetical protein
MAGHPMIATVSKLGVSTLALVLLASFSSPMASAQDQDLINWLLKVEDYPEIYRVSVGAAIVGDSEKQEFVANLLLGEHGNAIKHQPYEGIRFLYRAAIAGRPTAMTSLSKALKKGTFGLKQSARAAQCWSKTPSDVEDRLACVALTDFRDRQARPPCSQFLIFLNEDTTSKEEGVAKAKLCLANKTPALLVPGGPPGPPEFDRSREWARYGIEWSITGEMYSEKFEQFRAAFNSTTRQAIESEQGSGYLEKLAMQIDARIKAPRYDAH